MLYLSYQATMNGIFLWAIQRVRERLRLHKRGTEGL